MSTSHDEHESAIKTPRQLITVVILSFVVPILIIVLLVAFVNSTPRTGTGSQSMLPEAVEARIRPVGGFELRDASAPVAVRAGDAVYKAQCAACHDAGVAGAPRFGDKAGWAARLGQSYELLLASVLKGKGAMAAQSGGEYSDHELALAMVHLVNSAGGKLEAPAAAAPAAPAPAAASASAPPPASAPAPAPAPVAAAPTPSAAAPAAAAPAPMVAAAPAAPAIDGKAIYNRGCMACHAAGVAGAPKLADKAGWGSRLDKGIDGMTASVIKGLGAMPPRGAVGNASDAELRAAVEFMVSTLK